MRLMDTYDFSNVNFAIEQDGLKKPPFSDAAAAFDIETTTYYTFGGVTKTFDPVDYKMDPDWYDNAEKFAVMYVWQFAVDTYDGDVNVYMGRTWQEFDNFIKAYAKAAREWFGGNRRPILYVYVHNLGYEFQFLRGLYNANFGTDEKELNFMSGLKQRTFARNPRAPFRTELVFDDAKIVFRDSLVLTQKSLAKWCKDSKLPSAKLDVPSGYYDEARTPNTPLTDFEIQYSINDVVSMVYGIRQYRDDNEGIRNIQMTQTGAVRRKIRKAMSNDKEEGIAWTNRCACITVSYNFETFKWLNHAFVGGWTHANAKYTGKVIENVKCFDFASDYPFCMSVFKYPVSPFISYYPGQEAFDSHLQTLDSIEDPRSLDIPNRYMVEFTADNIQTNYYNTFWSESKTFDLVGATIDNGKIQSAAHGRFIMTDLDYHMFKRAYSSDITVTRIAVAEADYLPWPFKQLLFKNYGYKTTLRGVEGEESKYVESKQVINSMYGVAVTKNVTDEVVFGSKTDEMGNEYFDEWYTIPATEKTYAKYLEEVASENNKGKTFLTYDIGIFITAYARYDLWHLISQMDEHVVYGDTDSLKGIFDDKDIEVINRYNEWVVATEKRVAEDQHFGEEYFHPCQPSGKECRLGVFDREDDCIKFKTLGAKRYAVLHAGNDNIEMTVAGLPKKTKIGDKVYNTADFLNNDFDNFCDGATWDVEQSGKKTHYYNDRQPVGMEIRDRDDVPYILDECDACGIAITPTTFSIGLADAYKEYVTNIKNGFVPFKRTDEMAEILQD